MNHALLRNPAFLFLLPAAVLCVIFLGQAVGPTYYGVSRLAQAASVIGLLAPICAGLAAWEGSRVRRGDVQLLAPVRTERAIALRGLLPVLVVALAVLLIATVTMLATAPRLRLGDLRVLATPVAVLSGHAAVGYLAGRRLPTVLSVPLSIVCSWLLVAYSIAIEPLWIRHLSGALTDCCDIATVPDSGALGVPILIALAACVAVAIALSALPIAWRITLAVLTVGASIAAGASLVSDLGSEPVAPRPASELVCNGADPQVCLWPEHAGVAQLVEQRAHLIYVQLSRNSVPAAAVVSEARTDDPAAWSIGVTPGSTRDAIDATLISGLLPAYPACADGPAPYPGHAASVPVALWLAQLAGVRKDGLYSSVEAAERRELELVRQLPLEEQLRWYEVNRAALADCGVEPRLLARR